MIDTVGSDFLPAALRAKEVLEQYRSIGPAGTFGAATISGVIDRATKAWESQDLVAILRSYQELKGVQ